MCSLEKYGRGKEYGGDARRPGSGWTGLGYAGMN